MNIVLIGIQGCGKGTLVAGLEEKFNLSLISMGQLFRDEIATGSDLGEFIKQTIDKGELVPTDITVQVLQKKLSSNNSDLTIFDGFPRNAEQQELLNGITKIDLVIHLNLAKDVAIDRILNRLTCAQCGYITKKQAVLSDSCPQCCGKLVQRSDDTLESINKRFEIYEQNTYPLLERYKVQGVKVIDINANQTPDAVLADVLKVL